MTVGSNKKRSDGKRQRLDCNSREEEKVVPTMKGGVLDLGSSHRLFTLENQKRGRNVDESPKKKERVGETGRL